MADLGFTSPSWAGGNPFLGQGNPYLQQNIDATMGDMARNYNLLTAPATTSAMAKSGSFGNSGLDQMQQNQLLNQQQAMGNQAAQMRMQDYNNQQQMYQWDQGFNANNYQNAFNNNLNSLQAVNGLLSNANQYTNQDLQNATNIQNTPMNYWQQFTNSANGIGQGYGTQTQSTAMPGNPLLGALGGWSLASGMK